MMTVCRHLILEEVCLNARCKGMGTGYRYFVGLCAHLMGHHWKQEAGLVNSWLDPATELFLGSKVCLILSLVTFNSHKILVRKVKHLIENRSGY